MAENRTEPPRWFHASVEWGPTAVFLLVYQIAGFYQAIAADTAATALALAVSWRLCRRVPVLPFVTLVLVLIFGGLTLWLQSALFAKMIPTLVNGLFAVVLIYGYVKDLPVLKWAIGVQMPEITAPAWRRLTLRYALFFVALALLNEAILSTQSTDLWVAFKTYGDLVLLLLFIASQAPFVDRHRIAVQEAGNPE